MTITARYGTWPSPVTAELLVADAVRLSSPQRDGADAYWREGRPHEAGREVIVRRRANGEVLDVLPPDFSARTLVHEYGSRCFVVREGTVYFTNFDDQRLYRLDPDDAPRPITPEPPTPRAWRYADPVLSSDGATLVCVRERHTDAGVENDLVAVRTDGVGAPRVLAAGYDFFASPALSRDNRRLAWICWDHPNMPWDTTQLHEAELDDELGVVSTRVVVGAPDESVQQPAYGPDGTLHFISDRSGWWNVYAEDGDGARALAPREAEFAGPAWSTASTYVVRDDGTLVVVWSRGANGHLGVLAPDGRLDEVRVAGSVFDALRGASGPVLALVGSPTASPAVVEIDLASGATNVLRTATPPVVDPSYISLAQDVEFPTEGGLSAHALYYAPTNPDVVAPPGTLPPLIVMSHGGPTAQSHAVLDLEIQYWTSRGFAVADVNYGGSTGYGRAYRERLKGQWGVVDLNDCVNAARFLAATGRADPRGLLIRGGSAGGYTTLCALTFRDDFAAGASYYGVGDLGALARDTHKFESRYLDGLVGPWPEAEATYRARSPIFHTELMTTPVILFQGLEDEVVPPAQADAMAEALRARGVPFAHLTYPGEQHGFRRAATITATIEAELAFYARVLGFTPADDLAPLEIENAERLA